MRQCPPLGMLCVSSRRGHQWHDIYRFVSVSMDAASLFFLLCWPCCDLQYILKTHLDFHSIGFHLLENIPQNSFFLFNLTQALDACAADETQVPVLSNVITVSSASFKRCLDGVSMMKMFAYFLGFYLLYSNDTFNQYAKGMIKFCHQTCSLGVGEMAQVLIPSTHIRQFTTAFNSRSRAI